MNTNQGYESWGRYPKARQNIVELQWASKIPPLPPHQKTVLPYGLGRSYGDLCLNDGGTVWVTPRLNHFLAFDQTTGVIRCEAGVSLEEILNVVVPHGWFLPVTPGTKFVTIAGAVANDVHGKNHHLRGTFGEHVLGFELWRSDGERLVCSPTKNADWFRASIGGLGLTGLMLWVELQLKKIPSPFIVVENIKYQNLDDFFRLAKESESSFEYTVAWVDCLASGKKLGRGIFMRGNDATAAEAGNLRARPPRRKKFPCDAPNFLLNRLTVAGFNAVYFHKHLAAHEKKITHYDPFFYPLDSVLDWNRLYGRRGFLQYQFVVPPENSTSVTADILERIARSGTASFLSVMKTFGDRKPAGLMSFPKKGVTVALDLPNVGQKLFCLLDQLDEIVLKHDGRLYPAKDARMSARHFKLFYPTWREFSRYIDPRFSSSFWRRVMAE